MGALPLGRVLDGLALDIDVAAGIGAAWRQDVHCVRVRGYDAWKRAHVAEDGTIELKARFVFFVLAFGERDFHRHHAVWVVALVSIGHPHRSLDAQP